MVQILWLANCYVRADFTGNRGAQVNWLGAIHDQELVFQEKRLRDQGTDATRSEQPGQRGNQADNKNGHRAGISVEVGELK